MELVWGSEAFIKRAHTFVESKGVVSSGEVERKGLEVVAEEAELKELPHSKHSIEENKEGCEENTNSINNSNNADIKVSSIEEMHPSYLESTSSEADKLKSEDGLIKDISPLQTIKPRKVDSGNIPIETFNVNDMINELRKELSSTDRSSGNKSPLSNHDEHKQLEDISVEKEEMEDVELYKRIPPIL